MQSPIKSEAERIAGSGKLGYIPLELVGDVAPTWDGVREPGYDFFTFPPSSTHFRTETIIDEQGNVTGEQKLPRRIEWLPSLELAEKLKSRLNRPNRPPMLRIAHDLLGLQQSAGFAEQVEKVLQQAGISLDRVGQLENAVDEAVKQVKQVGAELATSALAEFQGRLDELEAKVNSVLNELPPREVPSAPKKKPAAKKKAASKKKE